MPLPTSGALSYSQIRTEFSQTGAVSISAYRRGAGIVPNHTANASIPTSNSNIAVGNFYGAELPFTCDITEGGSQAEFFAGFSDGVIGSVNRDGIGKSVSNLDQVTFIEFVDTYDFKTNNYEFTSFKVSGDHTGSWWSTIVYRSKTFTRPNNGTFFSGATTWSRTDGPYCTGSGTHLFTLNLT